MGHVPATRGPTIKAINMTKMTKYRVAYLLTIRFRSLFCFMEKMGGLIWRLGRSQKSMTECHRSTYGMQSAGRSRKSRRCDRMKSAANKLSSMILQRYSRPGCEMACRPIPEPTHLPVLSYQQSKWKGNIPPSTIRFVVSEFTSEEDAG